jgi:hypothetical protein
VDFRDKLINIVLINVSRLLSCAHFNVPNFFIKMICTFFPAVSGGGWQPASLPAQAAVAASQPACSAAADGSQPACSGGGSQPACLPFHAREQKRTEVVKKERQEVHFRLPNI